MVGLIIDNAVQNGEKKINVNLEFEIIKILLIDGNKISKVL